MPTEQQYFEALNKADESGDTEAANYFAGRIREIRQRRQRSGSYLDALLQGATLGWSDELGGIGAKLGSWMAGADPERTEQARQQEVAQQRAGLTALRERDPVGSFAAEVVGSIPTAFGGLGAVQRGLQFMRPAAQMVTTGVLEGGITGAGAANEDRGTGAAVGAGMGGILAGALPAVGYGVQRGWKALDPLRRRLTEEPTTTAARVLSENLQAGGVSPAMLRSRQRQLGPQATIADIAGSAGVTLGQMAIQADPANSLLRARRVLEPRGIGSTRRLREEVAQATGITDRLQPSLDAVRERQQAIAAQTYARANAHEIPLTDKLKGLLARPPMRRAFEEAKEAAATRGEELPPLFKMDELGDWEQTGVLPDMPAWQRMKEGVDRLIESEVDPITGRMSSKGRDLSMMKDELLEELDDINPDYRQARNLFAGDEALQNAMRRGEQFLTMKTRDVEQAVRGMSDSEREGFLTGAVEAIREKMGRAREGEIGEFRFLETTNTREKLRKMFPAGREGDRQLAQLMRTLRRERTFATTRQQLIGNSQTALREAARRAAESGVAVPTSAEIISNPVRGTIQAGIQKAGRALSTISDKSMEELGRLVLDPNNVEAVISEMQRRGVPQEEIIRFVNRYSQGSAMAAPAATLGILGAQNSEN